VSFLLWLLRSQSVHFRVSDSRMIGGWWIGESWEGNRRGPFEMLFRNLLGVVKENHVGRTIAHAVSSRVRAQVRSCGICCEQSGTGVGFLRVLRFPLPVLIPPTAPRWSSSIIWVWWNRPSSGRRTKWIQSDPTPPHEAKKTKQGKPRKPQSS
jgi:hypothetical protein